MYRKNVFRTLSVSMALALVSLAAQAATLSFKADLKPSDGISSSGAGTLTATLDTDTNTLKYHVEFSGLSGNVTAAHFHGPATSGQNARPQVPVTVSPIVSPLDSTAILTPEQVKDLEDGKWYFNLHTAANPRGEIRGQVEQVK